jgi:hypothetical protein
MIVPPRRASLKEPFPEFEWTVANVINIAFFDNVDVC